MFTFREGSTKKLSPQGKKWQDAKLNFPSAGQLTTSEKKNDSIHGSTRARYDQTSDFGWSEERILKHPIMVKLSQGVKKTANVLKMHEKQTNCFGSVDSRILTKVHSIADSITNENSTGRKKVKKDSNYFSIQPSLSSEPSNSKLAVRRIKRRRRKNKFAKTLNIITLASSDESTDEV